MPDARGREACKDRRRMRVSIFDVPVRACYGEEEFELIEVGEELVLLNSQRAAEPVVPSSIFSKLVDDGLHLLRELVVPVEIGVMAMM